MRVEVQQTVEMECPGAEPGARLCFQRAIYRYDDAAAETGYRFIWRRPNGRLQPARGQAIIPSARILRTLLRRAEEEGWFA